MASTPGPRCWPVSATLGIPKPLRDKEDPDRMRQRLEEARTERLLARVTQAR